MRKWIRAACIAALVLPAGPAMAKCRGSFFKCPGRDLNPPVVRLGGGKSRGNGPVKKRRPAPPPSVRIAGDTAGSTPGCNTPTYAENLTDRQVSLKIAEKWWQEGPRCNEIGETNVRQVSIDANGRLLLGCAMKSSVMSTCVGYKRWSIPEQKRKARKKRPKPKPPVSCGRSCDGPRM